MDEGPQPVPTLGASPAKGLAIVMVFWGGWMLFSGDPLTQATKEADFYSAQVDEMVQSIQQKMQGVTEDLEWDLLEADEQQRQMALMRNAAHSLEAVKLSTVEIPERTQPLLEGLRALDIIVGLLWVALGMLIIVEAPGAMPWVPRLAIGTLIAVILGPLIAKGWMLRAVGNALALRIDTAWAAADPGHLPNAVWRSGLVMKWTVTNVAQAIWPTVLWAALVLMWTKSRADTTSTRLDGA